MGLTPNGYKLNYVRETLSYHYLSHGLGSETANIFDSACFNLIYVICTRIHMCKRMRLSMAYLGHADVGKRRGYVVGIFPDGWCLVPIYSNIYVYIFSFVVLSIIFGNSSDTHISLSHTVYNREIWVICKRYVGEWYACRIVPKVWEHVPIEHVNSPLSPNQTQVLEVAYYHVL